MVRQTVRRLCTNCEKETDFDLASREETVVVRKEPTKVVVPFYKCKECGDEVFDSRLGPDPFVRAYDEYRKKHSLLNPSDITSWRDAYNLTQGEVAKLLGIGTATLSRYENGALQEESHDKLLRFAMQPSNLLKLIEESGGVFRQSKKDRLIAALREARTEACSIDNAIMLNLAGYGPSEFSGYKKLDLTKMYNLILFLCRDAVPKTKLNKLLFYVDFKHFREYALPVTGARYAHIPFGPAPDNYEMYFASLNAGRAIEFIEELYPNGYVGELLKATRDPDLTIFSDSELRIMASVAEDFAKFTATEIAKFSHEETGYQETTNGKPISYAYASSLKY